MAKRIRGFAAMTPEKRREISRKGARQRMLQGRRICSLPRKRGSPAAKGVKRSVRIARLWPLLGGKGAAKEDGSDRERAITTRKTHQSKDLKYPFSLLVLKSFPFTRRRAPAG
jgi:Stress-induced bacterial acidophilic repeat motif